MLKVKRRILMGSIFSKEGARKQTSFGSVRWNANESHGRHIAYVVHPFKLFSRSTSLCGKSYLQFSNPVC